MKRFTSYYWYTSWYKTKSNNIVLIAQKNKFLCCEIVFQIIMNTWISYIGGTGKEFTQRRLRQQRERQKSDRFWLEKQQLWTCITLFSTFLCRRCTTTTWNCLISRFVEDGNKRQQHCFSFPELWYSPLEFNSKNRLPTFDELNEIK